jgi:hypothetical protein
LIVLNKPPLTLDGAASILETTSPPERRTNIVRMSRTRIVLGEEQILVSAENAE